jgi:hypothetical protein
MFVSDTWTIEDSVVWVGSGIFSMSDPTTRVKDNQTDEIAKLHSGPTRFLFTNSTVLSRKSGDRYRIPWFQSETFIRDQQLLEETLQLPLGSLGCAGVEVVDKEGRPLTREHKLGIILPDVSLEVTGPENSPLYVLLPPGVYLAYIADMRRIDVEFTIREHDESTQRVTLRDEGHSDR